VRRVAQTLGVSRSQLHERLRHGTKARRSYRKRDDAQLLEPVRRLVDNRPTYGYRRIGALLNKERLQAALPRLNHKRIYRLLAQNGCCGSAIPVSPRAVRTKAKSSPDDLLLGKSLPHVQLPESGTRCGKCGGVRKKFGSERKLGQAAGVLSRDDSGN
jgi:hypothetical protein